MAVLSLTSDSILVSAISVCHVVGDDQRTGEDLVKGGGSAHAKMLHVLLSHPLFNASHILPPRKDAKGKKLQTCVYFTLPHSKGNIH